MKPRTRPTTPTKPKRKTTRTERASARARRRLRPATRWQTRRLDQRSPVLAVADSAEHSKCIRLPRAADVPITFCFTAQRGAHQSAVASGGPLAPTQCSAGRLIGSWALVGRPRHALLGVCQVAEALPGVGLALVRIHADARGFTRRPPAARAARVRAAAGFVQELARAGSALTRVVLRGASDGLGRHAQNAQQSEHSCS